MLKIVLLSAWVQFEADLSRKFVPLAKEDQNFIHFSEEHNIKKTLSKFFNNQEVVILSIDRSKVIGDLRYETNKPGGDKYFHLYHDENGQRGIPREAVLKKEQRLGFV